MDANRIYKLNEKEIKSDFKFKNEYELESGKCNMMHSQGKEFKLVPFVANEKKLVSTFNGVVGEFSRIICDKKLNGSFDVDEFIAEITEQIEEFEGDDSKQAFKSIIQSMFINNDKLVDFDIRTMNYVTADSQEEKYARFLFSVLMDDELKEKVKSCYYKGTDNILNKLVLSALPELKDKKVNVETYKCYLPFVKDLFKKDFTFLISNEELYRSSVNRVLEYYNMFYISQLSLKLDSFEKADLTKADALYYTLSWESTSKNRTAYSYGYEKLKFSMNHLFSHAITLEFLNHHNLDEQLGYLELYNLFKESDDERISSDIEDLINEYKKRIGDISWEGFNPNNYNSGSVAFDSVHKLFDALEYQFKDTSRTRAYEAYKNWFKKFLETNFGKRRGSLGYNLNLTEEDIILFTKICINNNEKLKVSTLFDEFEKRGMYFDRDSRTKIISLYEKLNLLEKKSDSGDAQYVRSVL